MAFDFSSFKQKTEKAIEFFKSDIATLRTGRASVQMLDPVRVEAYGTKMSLIEVASVNAPDPNMIVVSPWDKNLIEAIEKAIATADLNVNPTVDGDIIRIKIPPLTEETRREMVKLLGKKAEAGKVAIRSIRSETKDEIEFQEELGGVSEDEIKRDLEELDKIFKHVTDQIDDLASEKEQDLMKV